MVQQNKSLRQRMRGINPRVQQWMRNAKTPEDHEIERLRAQLTTARAEGRNEGLEEAAACARQRYRTWKHGGGMFVGDATACEDIANGIIALKTPAAGGAEPKEIDDV